MSKQTLLQVQKRIENLKKDSDLLIKSECAKLPSTQKNFFLAGFSLAKFDSDIVYQMAYSFSRTENLDKEIKKLIGTLEQMLVWNDEDSQAALSQGWNVYFNSETEKYEIQKEDEQQKMKSDKDALVFVKLKAGVDQDDLCLKALQYIELNNTNL